LRSLLVIDHMNPKGHSTRQIFSPGFKKAYHAAIESAPVRLDAHY